MSQSDSIAGAFGGALADGPADLTKSKHSLDGCKQRERFFDQAYWLGVCANLVYPDTTESNQENEQRVEKLIKEMDEYRKAQGEAGDSGTLASDTSWIPFSEEWQKQANELDENDLDAIAEALHGSYRKCVRKKYLYPWRWFSEQRLTDINQAKERWSVAHELWVQKARDRIAGDNAEGGMNVEFVSRGGIEYFLAGDAKLIILCFRGTEPNKFGDILTDLLAWQTKVPDSKAKLHDGFWSALDGVWDGLRKSLTTDSKNGGLRNTDHPDSQKLWITGHSLGGALATLAAYRLERELKELEPRGSGTPEIGGVFTFGQPRVGDSQFAREYKQFKHQDHYLNDHHFRFVNNNDVVTTVPPKSLWAASVILEPVLSKLSGSGSGAKNGNGNTNFSFEYSDVGRVVLANRADRLRLLTPDQAVWWKIWKLDFWWPLGRWTGRIGSRLKAPFMPQWFGGFANRFVPDLPDHSMTGYQRVLNIERAHHAFVRRAAEAIKKDSPGKQEGDALKTAEKSWAALKARADHDVKAAPHGERCPGDYDWCNFITNEQPEPEHRP